MEYLAVIDREHMDNGMFLSTLARSLSALKGPRPLLIHGDSAYTERIIQTGVMREEATLRSIRDLNIRLVSLMADEGVAVIGLNGHQRSLITLQEGELRLDRSFLDRLPESPLLLLSSLAMDLQSGKPVPVPLPRLTDLLAREIGFDELLLFDRSEQGEIISDPFPSEPAEGEETGPDFRRKHIPAEFHDYSRTVRLITAGGLQYLPDLTRTRTVPGR